MGEEVVEHEGLLWDEHQSWPLIPNLAAGDGDEDCGGIKSAAGKNKRAAAAAAAAVKGKKRMGGGESEDHELHIWTERERRKKMRNMFSSLHALLPHIPPKADKSTIVDEAVKQIRKLQGTVEELERRKLELAESSSYINTQKHMITFAPDPNPNPNPMLSSMMGAGAGAAMFKTWASPNVILNMWGREAHISVCSVRKPGLLTAVCFVMEKNNLELVSAQASSDRATSIYMIHARLLHFNSLPSHPCINPAPDHPFPIEEQIFKQAAAEIIMFLNA